MDFLNRGRWFFDPERGLQRSCKDPQKSDTALRKFWTKERLEAEKQRSLEEEEQHPPKKTEEPKPACGKRKGKKQTQQKPAKKPPAGRKRGRQPKQVVPILSDSESSASGSDTDTDEASPPAPKRSRGKAPASHPDDNRAKDAIAENSNESQATAIAAAVDPVKPATKAVESVPQPAVPPSSALARSPGFCAMPAINPRAPSSPNSMMQMLMSMAYDNATVNARMLEVSRREKECDRREQMMDSAAVKSQFMDQAAKAAQFFFSNR